MLGKRYTCKDLQDTRWELVIAGGGVSGAAIAMQAARLGIKTLLLERRDFSWGTSSRSSKMVHGGLRYLAMGDIRLTRHSLKERERLLRDLPELVVRKTYLFPIRKGEFPGRFAMSAALWLYDFLAGIRDHRWLALKGLRQRLPKLHLDGIKGAMSYTDAITDDSRLVMTILHEAVAAHACLSNYMQVDDINADKEGFSVTVSDSLEGGKVQIRTDNIINATGAFADRLSTAASRIRPQRGSHLFFSPDKLPVTDCLTLLHPQDRRPVFVFPWQGVTCVGTTDLDHKQPLDDEASVSSGEVDYLLEAIANQFPYYGIRQDDILSCMAGVRPIVASGQGKDPSKESREHAIWCDNGIISVSGGKLTTFRLIALDTLQAAGLLDKKACKRLKADPSAIFYESLPFAFGNPLEAQPLDSELDKRLRWILHNEMVEHLDDLMLRRTRLGILRPNGAEHLLERVGECCRDILSWDKERWQKEVARYQDIISRYYQPPTTSHADEEPGSLSA